MDSEFIDVIDKSDKECVRQVSLAISFTDGSLCLLGGLSHGSKIEFDKDNARKMIEYLRRNL